MRRLPSILSLALAALLLAVTGLVCLVGWVFTWQGIGVQVLSGSHGSVRYSALWRDCRLSSSRPAPLAEEDPRYLRLQGYFRPPRAGAWQAALLTQGEGSMSLAGNEWRIPALEEEPAPGWPIQASRGHDPALALDRDPATRFTSGAPQQGGESLTLDLGWPRALLGVILDAGASRQDAPAGLQVELSGDGKLYSLAARLESIPPGLEMTEVLFPALQARWLRLTQTGRKPVSYWSVHELYLVDDQMLARRARQVELGDGPQALTITLEPDLDHPASARGHVLAQVFLRPPDGPWQVLPAHRLSPTPQAGPPWLAWLALELNPWLMPSGLLCLGLLLMSLYRDWLWPQE